MCGISGHFNSENDINPQKYYHAHSKLKHRGPDDEGIILFQKGQLTPVICAGDNTVKQLSSLPHALSITNAKGAIGHHRLSIQDTSVKGHQPMHFDGLWVAFNGEIYNFKELRSDLIKEGYIFDTKTDTEVILKSWHCWGENCFNKFNGMWALAIYDINKKKLVLSRDRFGIKPLYYVHDKHLLFASEVKFFNSLTNLTPDSNLMSDYLLKGWLDHKEQTMLSPVKQLPPASWATYDTESRQLTINTYWKLNQPTNAITNLDEAAESFSHFFESSLNLRMRSDVPVGSLLSGGLDSNTIVGNLASRNRFPKNGFHTYSAVFNEPGFSEKEFINDTLELYPNLIPTFVSYTADDAINNLEKLIKVQEFPFRSLAVFSQFSLYEKIANEGYVTVLLNGQGADEIFGGYSEHYDARILGAIQSASFRDAFKELRYSSQRTKQNLLSIALPLISKYISEKSQPCHYSKNAFNNNLMRNLLFTSLPEYLRYEDRNSMFFSKETRLPFLDYRLVEWAFTLSPELKISMGETKRIQRHAVMPYIPNSIATNKHKMGFISPQEKWQKSSLKSWIASRQNITHLDFINKAKYKRKTNAPTGNWFEWRLACLNEWLEHV